MIDLNKLSDHDLIEFIWGMHRAETDENPHVFMKGVRSCLIELGYNENFINGRLYELMYNEYKKLLDPDYYNSVINRY